MKLTRLQTFSIVAIVIAIILFGSQGATIGVSSSLVDSKYIIEGSSSITALIGSLILLFFIFRLESKIERKPISNKVPLWKRAIAFQIDFSIALLSMSSFLALPIIIAEYFYTGVFQWVFTREYIRSTDNVIVIGSVVTGMLWVIFYYAYPLIRRKQTVGQFIMGYRISTKIKSSLTLPSTFWHMIKGFLVLCAGCITIPLAFFHPNKQLFHESEKGFYPELIS